MLKKLNFIFLLLLSIIKFDLHAEKIALLFLTIGELHHPDIWQKEIEKNRDKFSIYFHSKEPLTNPFFKPYRIKEIVPTSWDFHVYAWQELIKEAIKDSANTKFVFLSESCIPIRPLEYIYNRLMEDDNSYISHCKPWWPNDYHREVIELPKEHRWVNQEWVILNREHAKLVACDRIIIYCVSKHGSDTEAYPSSLLSYYNELDKPNVINRLTTYVNWKYNDGPHPYTFKLANAFTLTLMREAIELDCFFARKFSRSFPDKDIELFIKHGYFN